MPDGAENHQAPAAPATAGRLTGRRILITGAASGIGRATALLFAAEGAKIAMVGLHLATLRAAAAGIAGEVIEADIRDPQAVQQAVDEAAARLGGLDGIVTAAGINVKLPITETSDADWANIIALNLGGTFYTCRAAVPHLRAAAADCRTIVTIASGAALMPPGPNLTAYAASKGGVLSFTKALAKELAPSIRANVVLPGNTDTPITRRLQNAMDAPARERALAAYALNRVAAPEEIARAILFLTSSDSSYVTGVALPADGGRTFH